MSAILEMDGRAVILWDKNVPPHPEFNPRIVRPGDVISVVGFDKPVLIRGQYEDGVLFFFRADGRKEFLVMYAGQSAQLVYANIDPVNAPCSGCNGRGQFKDGVTVDCRQCKGMGWIREGRRSYGT